MMKYLQRLGKSLMLPVACLPVASILYGVGYWIDPSGWGANNVAAAILIKAGSALVDNMGILFAIGVGVGMSDDNDGTAGLAGLVSWLVITTLVSTSAVALFIHVEETAVDAAFSMTKTQFIGILAGIIGSVCYNRFKGTRLCDALSFFSGKRCVTIVTAGVSLIVSMILLFVWPVIYNALVVLGTTIISLGPVGSGIYAALNRALIPFGLHHALNSVFWFDVAGISDLSNFWNGSGVLGKTGMYMTGFFPVMMFGLPAAALAMYHTAKTNRKKLVAGLLLGGALSSFFTGVTEPLEFAFMFLAPGLYFIHAGLTGILAAVCFILPVRSGFNFSAGFVDWFLSFKAPLAQNPLLILPIGLASAIIYYLVFRAVILKCNLKTPGREEEEISQDELRTSFENHDFVGSASVILEGLGGRQNVISLDNCITRLRLEVKEYTAIDEKKIKSAGVAGIIRPSKNSIQIVIGTKVQFVADEMKKLLSA